MIKIPTPNTTPFRSAVLNRALPHQLSTEPFDTQTKIMNLKLLVGYLEANSR